MILLQAAPHDQQSPVAPAGSTFGAARADVPVGLIDSHFYMTVRSVQLDQFCQTRSHILRCETSLTDSRSAQLYVVCWDAISPTFAYSGGVE